MILFLGTCFLVGLSASAAIGPIFILTFNRSSAYGFLNGFATGLGAAFVDGIYFLLGLAGILPLIASSKMIIMMMNAVGGLILIIVGVRTLRNRVKIISEEIIAQESLLASSLRSFMITLFNPAVILFFMVISIKFFQDEILTNTEVLMGSLTVMLGSLTMLTIVAFFARWLGRAISVEKLRMMSYASGLLFMGTGAYFIFDFVKKALRF